MCNLLCSTVTVAQAVMEYNTKIKPIKILKNTLLEDHWHFTLFFSTIHKTK